MRLLVVNSNTSQGVTDMVAAEAQLVAGPEVEIVAVTAPYGPAAIETPEDVEVSAGATLEAMRAETGPVDAAIIACFSDPGLLACRMALRFPVFGIAEAAMRRAVELGPRFSILTVAPTTVPGIRSTAANYGVEGHLAGVHALDRGVLASHADRAGTLQAMARLADEVLAREGPDVLVLGGAVTAGMARDLAARLPVPVLDGLGCAVELALQAAREARP
ncbi:aspartate/glutamate racemase family protein [Albibacillus kandeliae]|uniref:aspartate/glutamate racemase family protein n=1 Tax=Albibacillus kandeliae TaxID=2174228 RepID=UPI001300227B|nr:aspartate/glutamate racemase family protein [Albibacillus kandeliae]